MTGPLSDPLGARLQAALGDAYAVEGKLGEGGFAVVFLVRDVSLKRKLAVKVLSPDIIASHSALERFRREAETVAQLSHPNIVPLHFIGQKDDLVYLVMQAIGGGSLADRMEREKKLGVDDTIRILGEVASALAHAHKNGVVHRDIKPHNVLLDADSGRALVTDFGIARTEGAGSLTATGMTMGSPTYLSPEQVTGEPMDHRVDIYALGVMAYEMLAGEAPFVAPTPTAAVMKRLAGPPASLRTIRPDVPKALDDLVLACLAVDPNERVQNAGDFARALTGQSPVSGVKSTSMRQPAASPSRVVTKVAIAALIVAAISIGWLINSKKAATSVAASPIDSGMVLIAAGTYVIGSNDFPATRPSHPVQLAAFGLDTREVTVAQYKEFMDARQQPAPWDTIPDASLPVTRVRFAEADNYCKWRHADGGRLPTEAEWEAAARGAEGRLYPWGREWKAGAANAAEARTGPAPGGSHPEGRTPEGIDDLVGNVWEWTSTPFAPYGDAKAPVSGMFVIRGGGFSALQAFANAVFRAAADPAADRASLAATGFRCAMTARASEAR